MTDQTIIQMAQETCRVLFEMPFHVTCNYLVPSYNFLLQAAKANHPADPFLGVLASLPLDEEEELTGSQINILLMQLRIALEALQTDGVKEGPPVYGGFVES